MKGDGSSTGAAVQPLVFEIHLPGKGESYQQEEATEGEQEGDEKVVTAGGGCGSDIVGVVKVVAENNERGCHR